MLTKAKRFFRNPIYLLAVVVSLAVVGVGAAFAISVFAGSAPEGWEQEDADAITTRNPYVLYLDEGDYGDHVDVSFDVTRHLEQSSTDYKQINSYTERTESTYYGVKARVSGTRAAYYWYDENGTQQSVNGVPNLLSYLPNEYTVNKVWNEAPIDSNAKVWLYATKSVDACSFDNVTENINISFCCASIPIDVYKSQMMSSDGSKRLNQSFSNPYSPGVVRIQCQSKEGYTTYTFDDAKANWGCEDTMQAYRYDIGSYGFGAGDPGVSYSLVLGGSTSAPPILGVVRNNSTVNAGLWGYQAPAIIAAYAPNYEYTVPITTDRTISAEPSTVEGTSGESSDLTYHEYSSFTLKKSPAGGFYFTEDTGSAEIPYAESREDNDRINDSKTNIPNEVGDTVNLYSVADPTKLLRTQKVSKIGQSYSTWTETEDSRTFTVTGTVKNSSGDVISTFHQPAGPVSDESNTLGFMHITADSGSFEFHENTAGDLVTIRGIGSSGGLSAKMGVKVHYDMSPLENDYTHVQYAANSGYVSSDHEYALENPIGDGDGRADIISTNYGGISTFIDQGSPHMNADDGLFARTVKLSGTSDANKAPMYSANGTDYKMIDAWQLMDNGSDILWPVGTNDMVNVTVGDLFKSLSSTAGYDSADVYGNAQNKFQFDSTTGLFLYTFTVQPKVGKTVSYVAEYTDSNNVTRTFPLSGKYLPAIYEPGSNVTVKDKLNIEGWTFAGWEIDESSLPAGTTLADIGSIMKDGDGKVTSFIMPDCHVVMKGVLTPPDTQFTLTYNTNENESGGAYDLWDEITPSVPQDENGVDAPTQTFGVADCTPVYDRTDVAGVEHYKYEYTFPERTTTAETHRFIGWREESYYGSPVQKIRVSLETTEYTVYAMWSATVTYKPNYPGATESDVVETYDVHEDSYVNVKSGDIFTTPAHAEFKRWNIKADGTGTDYDYGNGFSFYSVSGEVTLYAQWDWDTFRLAYDKNTDATVNDMPADVDEVY